MNQEPEWTPEEEEAFNAVEKQSNLGKQILRDMKKHEPVFWVSPHAMDSFMDFITVSRNLEEPEDIPLYLHPSDAYEQGIQEGMKRERALWELAKTSQEIEQPKPLTDEQIDDLSREMVKGNKSVNWLARAIEAAHGIKEQS
jgi:hypothetical protein